MRVNPCQRFIMADDKRECLLQFPTIRSLTPEQTEALEALVTGRDVSIWKVADFGDEMFRFAKFMKHFSGSIASCRDRLKSAHSCYGLGWAEVIKQILSFLLVCVCVCEGEGGLGGHNPASNVALATKYQ